MVKNLNTIEKSERIRIGKHVPDEQAMNTIIINASSNVIHAPEAGLYISPIRLNNSLYSNVICYDVTTKEVIDSGIGLNLQGVTETGNSTTETLQFMNTTTSFITASNVGIANTNPQHELSVGGDTYIAGNLTVVGQTTSISTENLRVKDAIIELGENNTDNDFVFDLGLIMTRPGSNVTASYIESSNEYIIGYTQNSASDTFITPDTSNLIQMRVYGDVTANSFIGDGSLLSNVVQDTDLSANLDVIRSEMVANTIQLREDLQSNASILRDEMTANTIQLREDLQSNASILRDEMTANTIQLHEDLQSNANILRDEMTANTIQLHEDLQSNANILRDEMAANTVTIRGEMASNTLQLRTDLQSNASILRDEMAANTVTIRGEMTANTLQLRTDLQSNATILRSEMAANVITIRGEMAANTLQLRTDLQSNVSTLRSEMAANTISIREEMQSNLALKANIESPVFTGIITGDGGGISNISLQHVTEYGNSTDRTITMSNALSMVTSGNVGVNTPTPQRMLHVAGDILADDDIIGVDFYGDDATFTGGLTVSKDTLIYGNLEVRGNTTYLSTQNLLVEDPILALGVNNASSSLDTGIVLVYQGSSNVAFGYRGDEKEFIIGHTLSSPEDNQLVPDTSNSINVHVYGEVTADSFIGDGGLLSNIASNLHQIALNGNVTSETIILDGDVTGLSVTNNVFVGGNVTASSFTGDGGLLSNIASNLHQIALNGNITSETIILDGDVTGLSVTNNVFVGGNVTASSFTGDGGLLSNIASNLHQIALNGNITSETIILDGDVTGLSVTNNVFVGGNVTASSFTGDGGLLSNIASNLHQIALNGNITSETIILDGDVTGLSVTNNVFVGGNVTASSFTGDGGLLSNIASNLHQIALNGNITSETIILDGDVTGLSVTNNVFVGGNVTATSFRGDGGLLSNIAATLQEVTDNGNTTTNTLQLTNIDVGLVATGNIEANYFLGDGSLLENVASNLERIVIGGNVTSQTIHIENVVSLTTTGNVGIANSNPTCDLAIGSNVCFNDTGSNVLTIDGNILAHRITLDSIQIASVYALEYVTQTGNTTSNTIEFTNESTGLVTTANVGVANANPIHTLDVGSNLWVDDVGSNVLYVNGNVHVAGAQLTTDGKVGIANTNPQHDLSVGSNLYVDDVGSNVLVVHGNASIGTTLTVGAIEITPAYTLEEVTGEGNVTSNVIQFTNSNVGIISSGGIIINKDAYACKHYAYSNTSVPTDFSNVSMTFASNVFHAKITAQLTHGNEEVSTMILDVQGGTRDGTTSSLNIASGPGSVFGNTNTKPWSGSVGTTPTSVILEPSDVGTTTYGIDLYVEYKSFAADGKLESISIGTESVKSFIY
jgi:D-ribose pyranose/furanose isomerase RbsD